MRDVLYNAVSHSMNKGWVHNVTIEQSSRLWCEWAPSCSQYFKTRQTLVKQRHSWRERMNIECRTGENCNHSRAPARRMWTCISRSNDHHLMRTQDSCIPSLAGWPILCNPLSTRKAEPRGWHHCLLPFDFFISNINFRNKDHYNSTWLKQNHT